MQTTQQIIANNLRLLMKHHKLRQEQTAEGSGVSKQTVSNLLNPHEHKSTVAVGTLIKLAQFFKIPVNYFFIADMTADLLLDSGINELINNYVNSSNKGREKIMFIAKTEMQLEKNILAEKRRKERRKSDDRRMIVS